jgi:hypothetical protein
MMLATAYARRRQLPALEALTPRAPVPSVHCAPTRDPQNTFPDGRSRCATACERWPRTCSAAVAGRSSGTADVDLVARAGDRGRNAAHARAKSDPRSAAAYGRRFASYASAVQHSPPAMTSSSRMKVAATQVQKLRPTLAESPKERGVRVVDGQVQRSLAGRRSCPARLRSPDRAHAGSIPSGSTR